MTTEKTSGFNAKEYQRQWYIKNKERLNAKCKSYYTKNKERLRKLSDLHYQKNKEKVSAYSAEYCRRPEIKERVNRRRKQRYHTEPETRLLHTLRCRLKAVLKLQHLDRAGKTKELLGCTIEQARQHIESQFQEGMNWNNHGQWHIDHIKPCFTFDLSDPEQRKICFHYTNLRPLWASDNMSRPKV